MLYLFSLFYHKMDTYFYSKYVYIIPIHFSTSSTQNYTRTTLRYWRRKWTSAPSTVAGTILSDRRPLLASGTRAGTSLRTLRSSTGETMLYDLTRKNPQIAHLIINIIGQTYTRRCIAIVSSITLVLWISDCIYNSYTCTCKYLNTENILTYSNIRIK